MRLSVKADDLHRERTEKRDAGDERVDRLEGRDLADVRTRA